MAFTKDNILACMSLEQYNRYIYVPVDFVKHTHTHTNVTSKLARRKGVGGGGGVDWGDCILEHNRGGPGQTHK